MSFRCNIRAGALAAATGLLTRSGHAQKQGEVVQTDTLGMNFVTYNFDTGKTTGIGDVVPLSEFIGLHWFFLDGLRIGANLQLTEYLTNPKPGQSRFATFAVLPQIGWHFWGPLFAAVVFTIAPWTQGGVNNSNNFDVGVQLVVGAAIPLFDRLKLTIAAEVPYNTLVSRTIGFTPLLGVSIRL